METLILILFALFVIVILTLSGVMLFTSIQDYLEEKKQ